MSGTFLPPDCTVGPGVADVRISPIGGRNPVTVEASNLAITWEINQPSQLVADFALDSLIANFQPLDQLQGRWIRWQGNALGTWAGVVTKITPDVSNGSCSLECVDFSYYLLHRNLPNSNRVITGPPGAVAVALIAAAERDGALWLSSVSYDGTGDALSVQLRGQPLLQQLQQNAADSGQQFQVSADRVFTWKSALGKDRTETVQLSEGMEIARTSPAWDINPVVNDLTVQPSKAALQGKMSREIVDATSVRAIGRQQDRMTTSDTARPAAIKTIGKRRVAKLAAQGRTVAFDVVNVNNIFSSFVEGDLIRAVMPRINLASDVRVLQRGWTLSDGLLLITGEIP